MRSIPELLSNEEGAKKARPINPACVHISHAVLVRRARNADFRCEPDLTPDSLDHGYCEGKFTPLM
jgi:hypothetical protein